MCCFYGQKRRYIEKSVLHYPHNTRLDNLKNKNQKKINIPEERRDQQILPKHLLEGLGRQRGPRDGVRDRSEDPVQLSARGLAVTVLARDVAAHVGVDVHHREGVLRVMWYGR